MSKPAAADIFGAAKPVDTLAREREIEEKLRKQPVVVDAEPLPKADTWRDRPINRDDRHKSDRRIDDRRIDDRRGDDRRIDDRRVDDRQGDDRRGGGSGRYDDKKSGGYDRDDRRYGSGGGGGSWDAARRNDRQIESRNGHDSTSDNRSDRDKSSTDKNGVDSRGDRTSDYASDEERFKRAQPRETPTEVSTKFCIVFLRII